MIINNEIGFIWEISIYAILIIPIVFSLLIKKSNQNIKKIFLFAVVGGLLEILSFVPSIKMIIEDDFVSTMFITLFCYVTNFWVLGPFILPIIAVCIALKSKLKSKSSKISIAIFTTLEVAIIVLRVVYGYDWLDAIVSLA